MRGEANFIQVGFSTGAICRGGKFSGGEFLRGNLPEFLHKILLMSCFLFVDSILRVEMLKEVSGVNFQQN